MTIKRSRRNKDKRYAEVDQKISDAISKLARDGKTVGIRAVDICREAKIDRATIYAHFRGVQNAVIVTDRREVKRLKEVVEEMEKQNYPLEMGFIRILAHIETEKKYFSGAMARISGKTIRKMYEAMYPFITKNWRKYTPELTRRAYVLFCGEMTALIYFWGMEEKFSIDNIDAHAQKLAWLAETAQDRLS